MPLSISLRDAPPVGAIGANLAVNYAGVPRVIVKRLNRDAAEMLKLPSKKEKFKAAGIELTPSTPEAFAERIRVDLVKWEKLMRQIGIHPE